MIKQNKMIQIKEVLKVKNLLLTLTDQNEEILAVLKKFREKSEKK